MSKLLLVLSGAHTWSQFDGTQRPTGFWAEEFIVPHRILTEAGLDITIATPGGRVPRADELSLNPQSGIDEATATEFRAYLAAHQELLEHPARLEDVDPDDFDAVLIPGGHGPMQDLSVDADIARILGRMLPDQSKVVASLCHGPAAFMAAGDSEGWLFRGRKLTAFTDAEEEQVGLAANAPWLLEKRLRTAGADYSAGPAWQPYVVVDGNLITGQNPASGGAAAEALLKALAGRWRSPGCATAPSHTRPPSECAPDHEGGSVRSTYARNVAVTNGLSGRGLSASAFTDCHVRPVQSDSRAVPAHRESALLRSPWSGRSAARTSEQFKSVDYLP